MTASLVKKPPKQMSSGKQKQPMHTLQVGVGGLKCAGCIASIERTLQAMPGVKDARVNFSTERLSLAWQGPEERKDRYLKAVRDLGFDIRPLAAAEEGGADTVHQKQLLWSLAVAGAAAGNIMLLSIVLWSTDSTTMGVATRDLFHWVSALIAMPTVVYSGRIFFRSAWSALRVKRTNMDVPISVALILTTGMSLFETTQSGEHVYFDSAVMLLFFLLIGRYLDARARGNARQNAARLMRRLAVKARLKTLKGSKIVTAETLQEDDIVEVAAGDIIPADGLVTKGTSEVDASLITGESMPAKVTQGDTVFAGTHNLDGHLEIRVTKKGTEALLNNIIEMLEAAEQAHGRYVRLADRAARLYTPVVHSMGALTFLGWWLVGGLVWQDALMYAVAVLIITCPCALGLAVPVVQVLAAGYLMAKGAFLKAGDALERLASIKAVVFDKTGTLTTGKLAFVPEGQATEDLAMAARLAAGSRHPLCRALTAVAPEPIETLSVKESRGFGLETVVDTVKVRLGSYEWVQAEKPADNNPSVWLKVDDRVPVRFKFSDVLRPDASDVIQKLSAESLPVTLLSGDREEVAKSIGQQAGIDNIIAGVDPVAKVDFIKSVQKQGTPVLMVGDGLNDAAALAEATVSMSPSSAVDISQNVADIVFQGKHLAPVYQTYKVACLARRLVLQNFAFAALYNVVAIPLAVAGYVTPLVAALAMSGSSLVVILNSFRLRLVRE